MLLVLCFSVSSSVLTVYNSSPVSCWSICDFGFFW